MPRPVRDAVGRTYRRLPTRWRLGARYAEFTRLAEAAACWSVDECRAYQLAQLRAVLRHASESCPFYRSSFQAAGFQPDEVTALDDMWRCPLLEKQSLVRHL